MNQATAKKPANTEKTYLVTQNQLPLSCPTKEMSTWNSHPKVYLDMQKTGEASCQYCGAHYKLESNS